MMSSLDMGRFVCAASGAANEATSVTAHATLRITARAGVTVEGFIDG